jgi:hypothetical protein
VSNACTTRKSSGTARCRRDLAHAPFGCPPAGSRAGEHGRPRTPAGASPPAGAHRSGATRTAGPGHRPPHKAAAPDAPAPGRRQPRAPPSPAPPSGRRSPGEQRAQARSSARPARFPRRPGSSPDACGPACRGQVMTTRDAPHPRPTAGRPCCTSAGTAPSSTRSSWSSTRRPRLCRVIVAAKFTPSRSDQVQQTAEINAMCLALDDATEHVT